jgi:hypothetical protein
MTTNTVNSMGKVRKLLHTEKNIYTLAAYYHIVEGLLSHYRKLLNKAKALEANQLLAKIKITIIQRMSVV